MQAGFAAIGAAAPLSVARVRSAAACGETEGRLLGRGAIGIVVLALLAACQTPPSAQEIAEADYGTYPDAYETLVRSYYGELLVDPDSVQYREITPPTPRAWDAGFSGRQYGYLICVTWNARNRMGGYTGYQTDAILVRDGAVVYRQDGRNPISRRFCDG